MQHFADFGIVKQANKQLKKLNELKDYQKHREWDNQPKLGKTAQNMSDTLDYESPRKNTKKRASLKKDILSNSKNISGDMKKYVRNVNNNKQSNIDPLKKDYIKKSLVDLDQSSNPNFSDIRKTTDRAASPTNYLGFRTDPYKGYGGMMEESIPKNELMTSEGWVRGNKVKSKYE